MSIYSEKMIFFLKKSAIKVHDFLLANKKDLFFSLQEQFIENCGNQPLSPILERSFL